jgi:hypothetical protein
MTGQQLHRDAKAIYQEKIKNLENEKKELLNQIVELM